MNTDSDNPLLPQKRKAEHSIDQLLQGDSQESAEESIELQDWQGYVSSQMTLRSKRLK